MRLPFLEVFDLPDALLSCARRESSTHAPQGLELLNGALTQQVSAAMAERLRVKQAPLTTGKWTARSGWPMADRLQKRNAQRH